MHRQMTACVYTHTHTHNQTLETGDASAEARFLAALGMTGRRKTPLRRLHLISQLRLTASPQGEAMRTGVAPYERAGHHEARRGRIEGVHERRLRNHVGAYASTWWTLGLPSGVTWADVEFMYIYANDTRYIYARGNRLMKSSTNSNYVENSANVFPAPAATATTIRLCGTASSGYTPICNTVQIVARK